jgi:5-methylcytosine-specific restriction endonuclease McrA
MRWVAAAGPCLRSSTKPQVELQDALAGLERAIECTPDGSAVGAPRERPAEITMSRNFHFGFPNTVQYISSLHSKTHSCRMDTTCVMQRIGDEILDFLYENRETGTRVDTIKLKPGVAFCFRRFHVLLTQMIRSAWLTHIRRLNSAALGTTADLEEFLFGSDRADLSSLRPMLADLQHGNCFYCNGSISRAGEIDHFVPWSRYPVDLGHNFVLAHSTCNGSKGALLAAEDHLGRWFERNRSFGAQVSEACNRVKMTHDLNASQQITVWAYEQVAAAGGKLWQANAVLVPISDHWRTTLEWVATVSNWPSDRNGFAQFAAKNRSR